MENKTQDLIQAELRVLGLVDRILGLEAEIAVLKSSANKDLQLIQKSFTWRVGYLITLPLRVIRSLVRKLTRRS